MKLLKNQSGFTLLELLISTVIIGILAVVVSEFYVQRLIDYARTDTLIILQSNTKQALESMEKDVRSARTIEVSNQWADANGPGGNQYGWSSTTGSPSTLVLALPTEDASGNLQYADASHNAILTNDVIYYVDTSQKTLYRRVIVNPICASAGGSVSCKDTTTCPPASASPSCPSDGKVIEDVANMVINYYDTNNVATSNTNLTYSLDTTLTQSRYKFGRTYSNSLTSRITLRNKP
jgi:prepilin-type N-terminal cleavage/methylation domain-containing protein